MKLQGHTNKLETNAEKVESQDFCIGDASVVIEILRNRLYEHKVRTLVQEYISNARDAMREVGKDNAFEVTVPTLLNPVFKVRDFGPGIAPDRMANVFIKYGSSTKRDTNEQTGGLGIGAKSAWSYTDSFTIVTFVDGIRRTYVAHIGCNNQGRLDLVSTDTTNECNGTEIQVAVKPHDIEEFRSAIFRAIYFWEQKPTLKGELDPPKLVRGKVISDLVEIVDVNMLPDYIRGDSYYTSYAAIAVIDGIPYAVSDKLFEKVKYLGNLTNVVLKKLVLHFGNGVVEVAASREAIADSPHTLSSLEKLSKRAFMEIKTHLAEDFGKVKSVNDFIKTYHENSFYFDVDNFASFNDYSVEYGCIKSPLIKKVKITIAHCLNKRMRQRIAKVTKDELNEGQKGIDIKNIEDVFYITKKESKIVENKRIREYLKTKNRMFLLEVLHTNTPVLDKSGKPVLDKDNKMTFTPVTYDKEFTQVIADLGAKDFQSIAYVEPPKVVKAKVARDNTQLCLHTFTVDRHKYTTLANNTQKWFFVKMENGSWPSNYTAGELAELDRYLNKTKGARICGISERIAKIVEKDGNFDSLESWLDRFKPNSLAINSVKAFVLTKNDGLVNTLSKLKNLDDKFIVEMVKEYKTISANAKESMPEILNRKTLETKEAKDFKEKDEKFAERIDKDYPLVKEIGYYSNHIEELAFYINAKFNSKERK